MTPAYATAVLLCLGSITANMFYVVRYLMAIKYDVATIRRLTESASGRTGELPDLRSPRR